MLGSFLSLTFSSFSLQTWGLEISPVLNKADSFIIHDSRVVPIRKTLNIMAFVIKITSWQQWILITFLTISCCPLGLNSVCSHSFAAPVEMNRSYAYICWVFREKIEKADFTVSCCSSIYYCIVNVSSMKKAQGLASTLSFLVILGRHELC